ncbi:Hint domain-containing protein [Paracoccus benzoatiresistens]|uniref:Hint domain-containing protein n=1 Tax=Paracoccus benzoatiresistens TaxID=2997341 RepID=A0ABT4J369_9RHOB|nr:Hint domain-containing protein [Paracoccus sp. EF6]MCZ0960833.1 Hint domain-containing protein [Paracoccus sp. EF6]
MDYQFTVLTVSQQITTKGIVTDATGQAPWSNITGAITMPGATLSTITLTDDDANFQSGRYNADATGQTLTTAVTFGNDASPTPAGTALSYYIHSIIRTPNADGSYDEFRAVFPRKVDPGLPGLELGGRYSVLLMPIARADGTFPIFSLSKTYTFKTVQSIGRTSDSVAYAPPAAVTCFAMGTMIDTPAGPRPVETLQPGDLVLTRDHGPQALRWQGGTHVSKEGLEMRPNLRPILIRSGALGAGCPDRDLVVSPQHRVLVRSRIANRLFRDTEILVAAKHLAGLPGIEVIVPPEGVSYFHLLFDRHEVVMSNGAWSESLYTGPQALASVSDAARREILILFPELGQGTPTAPARRLLTGREAQQLAERQLRNIGRRCLVEPL